LPKTKKSVMIKDMIWFCYFRVSTGDQRAGLLTQKAMVDKIFEKYDTEPQRVFLDEDFSGANADRPEFIAFQKTIQNIKGDKVVVVNDWSRISRDPIIGETFIKLCRATNTKVCTISDKWYDLSKQEDRTQARLEIFFATTEKEKKNDSTKNGVMSALLSGRYCISNKWNLKGYRYAKIDRVKQLVVYEPEREVVKTALENYANAVFQNYTDVIRYLNENGMKCRKNNIKAFLSNALYAGYLELNSPSYQVSKRKAIHEPIISYETHLKILDRMENKIAPIYKTDLSQDFPLRGLLVCDHCGCKMTASWQKNRHGSKYRYYICQGKKTDTRPECPHYRDFLNAEKIEKQLLEILKDNKINNQEYQYYKEGFDAVWKHRSANLDKNQKETQKEIDRIGREIGKIVDQIIVSTSPTVINLLEKKVESLESEKNKLAIKLVDYFSQQTMTEVKYRTLVNTTLKMLQNLDKIWEIGNTETKKNLLKLVFSEDLRYNFILAYRTQKKSLFEGIIKDNEVENKDWCGRRYQYRTFLDFITSKEHILEQLEAHI
jgi:site-specific DNA recombinase